jgi:glutamate 5-kinase
MAEKDLKIVVKIELWSLTADDGNIDPEKMDRLTLILSNLHNSGKNVLIVSSGAIALGMKKLNLTSEPESFNQKQAIAAIGQAELIKTYQHYFSEFNQTVAQVLLTKDVVKNEVRRQNATNTLNRLLDMGIIPVINENDTVSTDDIVLDDNYPLTLKVAELVDSDTILVKSEHLRQYMVISRGDDEQHTLEEEDLFEKIEHLSFLGSADGHHQFPEKIDMQ